MNFQAKRRCPESILVEMEYRGARDWQQRVLLLSDVHVDNPHCDRAMLLRVLEQARADGAPVCIVGDWFDLMQGRDDRRSSKSALAVDYMTDYIDNVIDESIELLEPYAENIVFISEGNHESSVKRRLETNPTKRLAKGLGIEAMKYAGWVQWRFMDSGRGRTMFNMYFHHGSGGGGPVTKGVIQHNRRAAMLNNAHIVVSGHVHDHWIMTNPVHGVTDKGTPYVFDQLHVSLPTFKEEFLALEGYHVEGGRPPKPLGGCWLHFTANENVHGRVAVDVTRAR